jgi:hypothetical protein
MTQHFIQIELDSLQTILNDNDRLLESVKTRMRGMHYKAL